MGVCAGRRVRAPAGARATGEFVGDGDRQPAAGVRRGPGRVAAPGSRQRRRVRPPVDQHGLGELSRWTPAIRHHGCHGPRDGGRRRHRRPPTSVALAVARRLRRARWPGARATSPRTRRPRRESGGPPRGDGARGRRAATRRPAPRSRPRWATCCRATSSGGSSASTRARTSSGSFDDFTGGAARGRRQRHRGAHRRGVRGRAAVRPRGWMPPLPARRRRRGVVGATAAVASGSRPQGKASRRPFTLRGRCIWSWRTAPGRCSGTTWRAPTAARVEAEVSP